MTCIVGVVDGKRVWMGGDSAGVGGYSLTVRKDKKVFKNDGFLIGFTSSFRMGQLLAHSLSPPIPSEGQDLYEYMVTKFINAVRSCFKAGGVASVEDEVESGGTFLVGYRGRLFKIETDYQVGESALGYDACGCGEDLALGAMFASPKKTAKERLLHALKAAETFSAGVCGPFTVDSIT